jgi:membrane carboxypeptidase/penicillin-binding protein PbpC
LASSYNIPAVVALNHVGVDSLARLLTQLGVTTLTNPAAYDLAITLGGGDVRLTELTAAYAALANGGRPVQTSTLLSVKDRAGKVLYEWQPAPLAPPVIDPRVAWLITDILSDNEARRPSFGTHSPLVIGRPAAVKTGTTTDFRDNWTVGYTPQVVVGVWVGNPDNRPMKEVSGVTGAGPIWHDFMRAILNGEPELPFERPSGLVQAEVCATSGRLPTQYCPNKRVEWFLRGTVPTQFDDLYQPFTIDRRTGLLADDSTPPEYRQERVYLVLPQEARAWGLRNGIQPPPVALDQVARNTGDLRLLTPDPYTVFQISPLIPRDSQRVKFSVAVPPGTRRVEYWLDDGAGQHQIGAVEDEPWWAWWKLERGNFRLWARATLADGTVTDSPPIQIEVTVYIPPDERPSSGEIK